MDDRIFLPLIPVWVLNGGLQGARGALYNLTDVATTLARESGARGNLASESAKCLPIRMLKA